MPPTRKVRVTPRAREDLKNIGRYTERTWGKAQRNYSVPTNPDTHLRYALSKK